MFNSNDSVIDSRDIQARFDDLESEKETLQDCIDEAKTEIDDLDLDQFDNELANLEQVHSDAEIDQKNWNESDLEEFQTLEKLIDDVSSSEFIHGLTLINESYWVQYCQELCQDIGDISENVPDYIAIDWDQTADNLSVDYSQCEFEGTTFYYRDC